MLNSIFLATVNLEGLLNDLLHSRCLGYLVRNIEGLALYLREGVFVVKSPGLFKTCFVCAFLRMRSQGALVDARDNNGNTPMHTAASLGLRKVVGVLLDFGADPFLRNIDCYSSFHMAAQAGCTTLMARFIDLGIDVNTKAYKDNTALHLVTEKGDASCVRMLLDEGADVNKTNGFGWTPLRWAACHNNTEALECLIDVGKGDLRQTLGNVGSLLHTAAYDGSRAAMQLLVKRGLDVASIIASNGETVIHNAAQNGGGPSVKWLLSNGASLDVEDHQGRKPQTSAVVEGTRDDVVLSALTAIADSEDGQGHMSAVWDGRSLLHLAAAKGFERCVLFLVSKGAGVDSKTANEKKQTAMHCAVSNGSKNGSGVARVLAKSGACVDVRDSAGKTPLHLAAAADGQLGMATTLLQLGASCNIADSDGMTPLSAAAKQGNLACCGLLVARGADMTLRDSQGENALGASLAGDDSTEANREAVMKLLIDLGCPVGASEVDAASQGGLTDSFAEAVTARMSGGTSARELMKAISLVRLPAGGRAAAEEVGAVLSDTDPAVSMMTVRVSSEPPPTFSSRRRRTAAIPSKLETSSRVYHVDSLRLRRAVCHLEGPDEVRKCLLLKLLLPPPAGWASVYQCGSGGQASDLSAGPANACQGQPPSAPLTSEVELSCNGDDFDEAGFEAVLEYLSTGQASCPTLLHRHQRGSYSLLR